MWFENRSENDPSKTEKMTFESVIMFYVEGFKRDFPSRTRPSAPSLRGISTQIYMKLFTNSHSFFPISTLQEELEKCDAFVLVFSVVDKASFTRVEQLLQSLQDMDLIRTRPVIIVANKIDLARSRAVSSQGKFEHPENMKKIRYITCKVRKHSPPHPPLFRLKLKSSSD